MWQGAHYSEGKPRVPTVLPTTSPLGQRILNSPTKRVGRNAPMTGRRKQEANQQLLKVMLQGEHKPRYLDEDSSLEFATPKLFTIHRDQSSAHLNEYSQYLKNRTQSSFESMEREHWGMKSGLEVDWSAQAIVDDIPGITCPSFDEGAQGLGVQASSFHVDHHRTHSDTMAFSEQRHDSLSIVGSATAFYPDEDWSPEVFTPSSTASRRSWSLPDWDDSHSIATFETADDVSQKENRFPTQQRARSVGFQLPVAQSDATTRKRIGYELPTTRYIPGISQNGQIREKEIVQTGKDFNVKQELQDEELSTISNHRDIIKKVSEGRTSKSKRRWRPFSRWSFPSMSTSSSISSSIASSPHSQADLHKPPRYQVLDEYQDFRPRLQLAPALNLLFRCTSRRRNRGWGNESLGAIAKFPKEVQVEVPSTPQDTSKVGETHRIGSLDFQVKAMDRDVSSEITQSPAFSEEQKCTPSPRLLRSPIKNFPPPPESPAMSEKRRAYSQRDQQQDNTNLLPLQKTNFEVGWWKNLPKRKLSMEKYTDATTTSGHGDPAVSAKDSNLTSHFVSGLTNDFMSEYKRSIDAPIQEEDHERYPSMEDTSSVQSSLSSSHYTDSFYSGSSHDDLTLDTSDLMWSKSPNNGGDWMMVVVTGWSALDRVDTYHLHQRIIARTRRKLKEDKAQTKTRPPRTSDYFQEEIAGSKESGAGNYSIVEVDSRAADLIPIVLDYLYQKSSNDSTTIDPTPTKPNTISNSNNGSPNQKRTKMKVARENAVPLLFLAKFFGIECMEREVEDFLESDLHQNHSDVTKSGRTVAQQYFKEGKDYNQDVLLRQILGVRSFSTSSPLETSPVKERRQDSSFKMIRAIATKSDPPEN